MHQYINNSHFSHPTVNSEKVNGKEESNLNIFKKPNFILTNKYANAH